MESVNLISQTSFVAEMISFGYLPPKLQKYQGVMEEFQSAAELVAGVEKLERLIDDETDRTQIMNATKTYWKSIQESFRKFSSVELEVIESVSESDDGADEASSDADDSSESTELKNMRKLSNVPAEKKVEEVGVKSFELGLEEIIVE